MKFRGLGIRLLCLFNLLLSGCTTNTFFFEEQGFFVPDDFFTIQEAIDFSLPGETVFVRNGVYSPSTNGEFFPIFMKNGVAVLGEDPQDTILDAENTEGVLDVFRYDDGFIENFTVTNGLFERGGGIFIEDSRATLLNLNVVGNRAQNQGSGIFILRSDDVLLENIVVTNNTRTGATDFDPAQVEIEDSTVLFFNNVVAQGDSDGLSLYEGSSGDFENNIFFDNGSGGFGVGFADLNPTPIAIIQYNLFFANEENDFFIAGDLMTAAEADALSTGDDVDFNFAADPLFTNAFNENFTLQSGSPAINAGNPDPAFNNPDRSRNDIGAYGGPEAELP